MLKDGFVNADEIKTPEKSKPGFLRNESETETPEKSNPYFPPIEIDWKGATMGNLLPRRFFGWDKAITILNKDYMDLPCGTESVRQYFLTRIKEVVMIRRQVGIQEKLIESYFRVLNTEENQTKISDIESNTARKIREKRMIIAAKRKKIEQKSLRNSQKRRQLVSVKVEAAQAQKFWDNTLAPGQSEI
jgi:hypothetical protein